MMAFFLVSFYRFWHGKLHLKGAGFLLGCFAPCLKRLHAYPLDIKGGRILVDFRDVSSMYWMNFTLGDRFGEEGLFRAIQSRILPDSIVWDIGANAGLLSYRLASSASPRELHLFEPNPAVYKLASSAVAGFPFVQIHQCGLSDRSEVFDFVIPEGGSTTGTLESVKTNRKGCRLAIQCYKADDLVFAKGFLPPSIIKIDTEGHETTVLHGMSGLIAKYKPVIFFEHISMSDDEVEKCIPPGYDVYSVSDADGTIDRGFNRHIGHNSALIPD